MPTTALGALSVPTTGTEVGTWGANSVNPNMVAIDGVQRGVQTISLSSATTFSLGAPAGSITPGTGPTAAQNAVLKFSGTLSGNAVITLPLPGTYIIKNNCVVGSNYIQLRGVGTGNLIGAPPGGAWRVYCDGTDVELVNMGHPGELLDLAVSTTPGWFAACTVRPYLLTDGSTYSTSAFPALAAALGSAFGGNGASTFGVPDLRNRFRITLPSGTNRVSGALNLNDAGGSNTISLSQANLPNVNFPVTDIGHNHAQGFSGALAGTTLTTVVSNPAGGGFGWATGTATTGISVNSGGSGSSFSVIPPFLVSNLTFIKT